MSQFHAFANADQSVGLTSSAGELTLENQGEQVNLYGNISFTIDKDSLALAKQLQQVIGDIVTYLENQQASDVSHAEVVAAEQANVTEVANPFL